MHTQAAGRADTREGVGGVRSACGRRAGLDTLLLFSSRLRLTCENRRSLNAGERGGKNGSSQKTHGIG